LWVTENKIVHGLFFKKQHCATISAVRIAVAFVILLSLLNDFSLVRAYYSDEGILQGKTDALRAEFRFSILDYFGGPFQVYFLYVMLIFAILMLLVGKYTKTATIISFILLASFHERNTVVLNSGDTLLRLLLFYLIFAPSGRCFSLDAISSKKRLTQTELCNSKTHPIGVLRLIQIQIALVYLFSFLSKDGITWKNGTAVYYFLMTSYYARFDFAFLGSVMFIFTFLTYFALLVELLFPVLIWFRKTRIFMIILAMLLQTGILLTSNIMFFSLIMIFINIAFIDPASIDNAVSKISKKFYKLIKC